MTTNLKETDSYIFDLARYLSTCQMIEYQLKIEKIFNIFYLFHARYCNSGTRLSVCVIAMETKQNEWKKEKENIFDRGCMTMMMMMMMAHREKNHAIIPFGIDSSSVHFLRLLYQVVDCMLRKSSFSETSMLHSQEWIRVNICPPACDWPPNDRTCFLFDSKEKKMKTVE